VTFDTIDELEEALREADYLPDRGLATALFLSLALEKPVLLEGEAGVGKTEAAKALARALGARLIRLQCYEGLDVTHAVYEWNYSCSTSARRRRGRSPRTSSSGPSS
jgi:MoxR-like ATPase